MLASASSAAIRAMTPFVLTAFSATTTFISLSPLSTSAFLKSFAISSACPFSTIILTSSVPVTILMIGSDIMQSLVNAWFGAMLIVMHAMLFFVLMTELLKMCWSNLSSSWNCSSGKRLMLDITASSETFRSYLLMRYLASALVLINFLSRSIITAGSVCSAFHTC